LRKTYCLIADNRTEYINRG